NQINRTMMNRSRAMWDGQYGADLIARQTGGFLTRNSNDFGLRRVMDDQRGYYLIGYRPGDETFNRRFHHIKARVKGRGLTLRTREGFYGVTEDEARPPEMVVRDQMGTLRLKGPAYDRAMREGIVYGLDLPVKQTGTFQFRVAVRDPATSRIGAAGQFIEVPNLRDNRLALSGIVIHGSGVLHDRT